MSTLPNEAERRKKIPIATGVIDYFPDALIAIAEVSKAGNDQHNPGEPLHWAREKSKDHADSLLRHLIDRGTFDTDGLRHSAKLAWRALALLQTEIEREVAVGATKVAFETWLLSDVDNLKKKNECPPCPICAVTLSKNTDTNFFCYISSSLRHHVKPEYGIGYIDHDKLNLSDMRNDWTNKRMAAYYCSNSACPCSETTGFCDECLEKVWKRILLRVV